MDGGVRHGESGGGSERRQGEEIGSGRPISPIRSLWAFLFELDDPGREIITPTDLSPGKKKTRTAS